MIQTSFSLARGVARVGLAGALGLCLSLASCAGATRANIAASGRAPIDAGTRDALRSEGGVDGQAAQTPPTSAPSAAGSVDPDLAIALVSGEPIDVRSFLARMWLRSSDVSRETLDRLCVERVALLEAERLEIAVSQTKVDERLEAAWRALGDSLERRGGKLSIAQHLQTELGVDTEYYRKQLRRESIAQLVAERVVRSWACSRERCVVRLIELSDQKAVDAFNAGLAAGRDFDSLARELHRYREKEPGGATITLVKNENAELSRVAFHTAPGQIAGPITAEEGRQLVMRVEQLLPALSGTWKDNAAAIEKSLSEDPVDDLEYVQWRAEVMKSYSVDLDPFFRLIGVSH